MTSSETFNVQDKKRLDDLDVKYLLHPFTALREHAASGPLMMTQGKGCWLTDTLGNRYLDGMAGVWCVNIGYGNEEMAESIGAQVERLSYYHSFSSMANDVATLLAQRLVELSPVPMSKVFFGSSGSDANDTTGQADLVLQQHSGPPRKEEDHLAPARLSRGLGHDGRTHRPRLRSLRIRPSAADDPPRTRPASSLGSPARNDRHRVLRGARPRTRGTHPRRGSRHGRCLHRRADASRRRSDRAPRGLL